MNAHKNHSRLYRGAIAAVIIAGVSATASAQLRVVSWNVADRYASNPISARTTEVQRVLDFIGRETVNGIQRPADIVAIQEVRTDRSTLASIANALNAATGTSNYVAWTETPGGNGEQEGFVYNTATVSVTHQDWHSTSTDRAVARASFRPVGYGSDADLWVYNIHHSAGSDVGAQTERRDEAFAVRITVADGRTGGGTGTPSGVAFGSDSLPSTANIVYAGDYNQQSSTEDANNAYPSYTENPYAIYQLGPANYFGEGQAVDPINAPGTWNHNYSFREIHTQSPHDGSKGLTTGGMDDRFDFQMISTELNDGEGLHYIGPGSGDSLASEESYHTFGNNGTNYNQAANVASNTGLDWIITEGLTLPGMTPTQTRDAVRDALAKASDHSPVVVDYALPASMNVVVSAPAEVIQGRSVLADVTVTNEALVSVALGADELDYSGSGSGDLSGTFSGMDQATGGGNSHSLVLDTSALGSRSGTVSVSASSWAAANASYSEIIGYTVYLLGDVDRDGDQTADDIDADDIDTTYDLFSTSDVFADLNQSGLVDQDDVDMLVEDILGTAYGDADLDGDVDPYDLNTLLSNYGAVSGGWADGNFDQSDMQIGPYDLNALLTNYGFGAGGHHPLPEPASVGVLAVFVPLVLSRRRKAKRN